MGINMKSNDDEWADDGEERGEWKASLGGHRPHAWMIFLMSLYDACLGQRERDGQNNAVLPRKADTYLVYGLRKTPADFSRDIDQTTSWLIHRQILRKALVRNHDFADESGDAIRCSVFIDAATSELAVIWVRFRALLMGRSRAEVDTFVKKGASNEQKASFLQLVMADDTLSKSLRTFNGQKELPQSLPERDGLSGKNAKAIDDAYQRVMQLVSLSKAIDNPRCVLLLLSLLDERGYARELANDYPYDIYETFDGLLVDFGFCSILHQAEGKDMGSQEQLSASVVCALAVLSALGPGHLAHIAKKGPVESGSELLNCYAKALRDSASTSMARTVLPRAERGRGASREALELVQATYEWYEGPMDARGMVVPSHAAVPLERGKVYYLGRQVLDSNFGNPVEQQDFFNDIEKGRAVIINIRPSTKTGIARVHAKILFDKNTGCWLYYALRNKSSAASSSARTLVIDPNDRVLDITLFTNPRTGRSVDHTTRNSYERGAVRLRRSTYLWLGPKLVQDVDMSIRWAPDEVHGAVFLVRGA